MIVRDGVSVTPKSGCAHAWKVPRVLIVHKIGVSQRIAVDTEYVATTCKATIPSATASHPMLALFATKYKADVPLIVAHTGCVAMGYATAIQDGVVLPVRWKNVVVIATIMVCAPLTKHHSRKRAPSSKGVHVITDMHHPTVLAPYVVVLHAHMHTPSAHRIPLSVSVMLGGRDQIAAHPCVQQPVPLMACVNRVTKPTVLYANAIKGGVVLTAVNDTQQPRHEISLL